MRGRRFVAAAVSLCALAALTACTGTGAASIPGAGTVIRVKPADRTNGPALAGDELGGGHLALSSYRGHVVVLNVWASWCGPCRAETPALEKSATELADEKVVFLGLNTHDSSTGALAFVRASAAHYPSLYDPDGALQLQLRHSIPPSAIPSTLVFDRQGRVAAGIIGPVTQQSLSALVGEVLLEGVHPATPTSTPSSARSS